ncbi:hypothetical protein GXW83_20445 [Streptacidiphilus sp. PB12-B1b]|uniref:ATP-binding protein n=1 Tax=Streptacidiphilus sp. PB12-B1b TaxID=2705012 RepID=UPI0015FB1C46|nr:ATP-binding protein [Streptacidiphilus sp. PB12-B1b]QMU77706.1 hypothetical protein GXW83_20445 [Streptacidiphilus sp. PB12-B1b]
MDTSHPLAAQHASPPWTPEGAPARYALGGERRTGPAPAAAAPGPDQARRTQPPTARRPVPQPEPESESESVPEPVSEAPGGSGASADSDASDAPGPAGPAGPGEGGGTGRSARTAPPAGPSARPGPEGADESAQAPWAFQRHAHWELPAQPRAVAAARHCAGLLLAGWGVHPDDVDQVVLLVGELAGNATLHGRRDMSVDLTLAGSHVDLTVSDYGPTTGGREQPLSEDESGRGLKIVECLADGVHIQRHRCGTNVWASYRLAEGDHR